MDAVTGLSPIRAHLPGPQTPPRAGDVPPKGPRDRQPPAWCSELTLAVSRLCCRATTCWRTRTPLPRRKTVKGPGLLLSPGFRFGVTGGQPSEWQTLCHLQLPCLLAVIGETPGCLRGHQGWESIRHSGDHPQGGLNTSGLGEASQPRGPRRAWCGAQSRRRLARRIRRHFQRAKWERGFSMFSMFFPSPRRSFLASVKVSPLGTPVWAGSHRKGLQNCSLWDAFLGFFGLSSMGFRKPTLAH